jgi:hypothetical protein
VSAHRAHSRPRWLASAWAAGAAATASSNCHTAGCLILQRQCGAVLSVCCLPAGMAGFFRLIAYSVPSMVVANASGALVSVCITLRGILPVPVLSHPAARVRARRRHSF